MQIANNHSFHRVGWLIIFLSLVAGSKGQSLDYDDYLAAWSNKCIELHVQWKGESDSAKRSVLAQDLVDAAIHAERPSLVEEVAADGKFAKKEIVSPENRERLVLRPLRTLSEIQYMSERDEDRFVVRRITAKTFRCASEEHWDLAVFTLNSLSQVMTDG